jgi:cellulose synthase/poly-beta-1,6-N-acetylglucosamine synthase-like glycosyltransferase
MRFLELIFSIVTGVSAAIGTLHYGAILLWASLSSRLLRSQRPSIRPGAIAFTSARSDLPGVTITMPGYNEEVTIVGAVTSALALDYPDLEIIVVNDGSKDRMMDVLIESFDMEKMSGPVNSGPIHTADVRGVYRSKLDSRLVVIDKAPAGAKADGANSGINFSTKPWVVLMDADELVDSDLLIRCMTEMTHEPGNVVAMGVTLMPTNECVIENLKVVKPMVAKNPWVGFQTVEYLGAFVVSRPGMAQIGALPIVSGGFGIFLRSAVLRVGGLKHPSLGEDLDLVVRINRSFHEAGEPYKILQVPEAVAWTEFPMHRAVLKRQRMRWHRGLREVLKDHRSTVGNHKYGTFGMFGMMQMFAFEWLAVFIEAAGYVVMALSLLFGKLNFGITFSAWLVTQAIGLFIAMTGVWTSSRYLNVYKGPRNVALLVFWAFMAQFGYRQMTVWWRVRSLFGKNAAWGAMPRVGFGTATTAAPVRK